MFHRQCCDVIRSWPHHIFLLSREREIEIWATNTTAVDVLLLMAFWDTLLPKLAQSSNIIAFVSLCRVVLLLWGWSKHDIGPLPCFKEFHLLILWCEKLSLKPGILARRKWRTFYTNLCVDALGRLDSRTWTIELAERVVETPWDELYATIDAPACSFNLFLPVDT
jgi:hypothetical protein